VKKKVLCFTGLEHHLRGLFPLIKNLEKKGWEVECLTAINNRGISDLRGNFEFPLREKDVKYCLTYDYLDEEAVKQIKSIRKILEQEIRDKFENLLLTYPSMEEGFWFGVDDLIENYVLMEKILKIKKPDIGLILHELNFWGKIFTYLLYQQGVPIVSLQEGLHPGGGREWLRTLLLRAEYSSKVCVWGEETKRTFLDVGVPKEKIEIVGSCQYDELLKIPINKMKEIKENIMEEFEISPHKKIILFINTKLSFFYNITKEEAGRMIDSLIDYVSRNDDLFLILKWHPVDDRSFTREKDRKINKYKNIVALYSGDITQLIIASDLIIGFYSTSIIEALLLKKPVIEVNFTGKDFLYSFAREGVASKLDRVEDLWKVKELAYKGIDDQIKKQISQYLGRMLYKLDGNSNKRIIKVIKKLLERKK